MHPLFHHINRQVPYSESDFTKLLSKFTTLSTKKGASLISPGEVIHHQFFVLKGSLRTYLIDAQGKEHTVQFAVEDWWVSDYMSYYKEMPAVFHVECLDNCEILKIHKDALMVLFDEQSNLERYFRKQLENAFVAFQGRILSSLHMSADERYARFVQSYPQIEQRVKNYQIASYLGITPESLSRIRKQRLKS